MGWTRLVEASWRVAWPTHDMGALNKDEGIVKDRSIAGGARASLVSPEG